MADESPPSDIEAPPPPISSSSTSSPNHPHHVRSPSVTRHRAFLEPHKTLQYGLYGVIIHSGKSADVGHYYCFGRDSALPDLANEESEFEGWHKFDDQNVTKSTFEQIKEIQNTLPMDSAYLLFYKRLDEFKNDNDKPNEPLQTSQSSSPKTTKSSSNTSSSQSQHQHNDAIMATPTKSQPATVADKMSFTPIPGLRGSPMSISPVPSSSFSRMKTDEEPSSSSDESSTPPSPPFYSRRSRRHNTSDSLPPLMDDSSDTKCSPDDLKTFVYSTSLKVRPKVASEVGLQNRLIYTSELQNQQTHLFQKYLIENISKASHCLAKCRKLRGQPGSREMIIDENSVLNTATISGRFTPSSAMLCEFCGNRVRENYGTHLRKSCSQRTILCNFCGQSYRFSNHEKHMSQDCRYRHFSATFCRACECVFSRGEFERHIDECFKKYLVKKKLEEERRRREEEERKIIVEEPMDVEMQSASNNPLKDEIQPPLPIPKCPLCGRTYDNLDAVQIHSATCNGDVSTTEDIESLD